MEFEQYPYYHAESTQLNYFVGTPPKCKKCKTTCNKFILVTLNTFKGKFQKPIDRVEHYCMSCEKEAMVKYRAYQNFSNGSFFNQFIIVPSIPADAMLYNINAIDTFSNTKMNVFTASLQQGTEEVNDFTVHSGKFSLEGAQISKLEHEVPTKDEVLNDAEVDTLLNFHATAPTQISAPKEKEQLDYTEEEQ